MALKWDHLSDLNLADSDFITPARSDLLLGAKAFTRIIHDGRQTGPRGTPSTINNCTGCVLYGQIQGSDVVEVANLTREQDVCRELTGSRHSYAVVFTVSRKRDLLYP